MPLRPCKTCDTMTADTAETCPSCGETMPTTSRLDLLKQAVLALLVGGAALAVFFAHNSLGIFPLTYHQRLSHDLWWMSLSTSVHAKAT